MNIQSITTILVLVLITNLSFSQTQKATIKEKTSLRTSNDGNGKSILRLSIDEKVDFLGECNRYYCKISARGNIGWVKKHLLIGVDVSVVHTITNYTTEKSEIIPAKLTNHYRLLATDLPIYIRKGSTTNTEIIEELKEGDKIEVTEQVGYIMAKAKTEKSEGYIKFNEYSPFGKYIIGKFKFRQSRFKSSSHSKVSSASSYKSSTKRSSYKGSSRSSSVRCSGYTQKRNRCKRRTTSSSGRCWQH